MRDIDKDIDNLIASTTAAELKNREKIYIAKNKAKAKKRYTAHMLRRVWNVYCRVVFIGALLLAVICTATGRPASAFWEYIKTFITSFTVNSNDNDYDDSIMGVTISGEKYYIDKGWIGQKIPYYIPDGYVLWEREDTPGEKIIYATYTERVGSIASHIFYVNTGDKEYESAKESASADELNACYIGEYPAQYLRAKNRRYLAWEDEENTYLLKILADDITDDEILKIAESVAECKKE